MRTFLFASMVSPLGNHTYTENIIMWHQYHKVRTTQLFTKKWVDFVSLSTFEPVSPVFYQYVTDIVFK